MSAVASEPIELVRGADMDPGAWQALVDADPRSTPFHALDWYKRFVHHHVATDVGLLVARSANGELKGGLPFVTRRRRGLGAVASGVAGTYGGPLVVGGQSDVEASLFAAFLKVGGPRTVRRELVWGNDSVPAVPDGFKIEIDAAILPTPGDFEEFLRDHFPKNRRNECNRSERRGLAVHITGDLADFDSFYAIYRDQAIEWGSRPESYQFLRSILEQEAACRFFVVQLDGEIVGGHLCFELKDQLFAWLGTTLRRPQVFPASLLIREEARYASEHGKSMLNLGNSMDLRGVANYKKLLGTQSIVRWLILQESLPLRWWRKAWDRRA